MALTKIVNGKEITLTTIEEQEIRDIWAAEAVIAADYELNFAYIDQRRAEYEKQIPTGDQLDAMAKQLLYMRLESGKLDPLTTTHEELVAHVKRVSNLITELDAVVNKRLAIKNLYPKP